MLRARALLPQKVTMTFAFDRVFATHINVNFVVFLFFIVHISALFSVVADELLFFAKILYGSDREDILLNHCNR